MLVPIGNGLFARTREPKERNRRRKTGWPPARFLRKKQARVDTTADSTPVSTAQTTAPRSRELAQLDSSMTREEAILSVADVLDPYGAERRMLVIERAEALVDECRRDPAYLIDGWMPYAEIVEQIKGEERWNND